MKQSMTCLNLLAMRRSLNRVVDVYLQLGGQPEKMAMGVGTKM